MNELIELLDLQYYVYDFEGDIEGSIGIEIWLGTDYDSIWVYNHEYPDYVGGYN